MYYLKQILFLIYVYIIINLSKEENCLITKIIDGDTFKSNCSSKNIRIEDIDAPEKKQPFGIQSIQMLKLLCPDIAIINNLSKLDLYNRHISSIICNNKNISEEMIKRGGAWVYKNSKSKLLKDLENISKKNQIGLWKNSKVIPPWYWRQLERDFHVCDYIENYKSLTHGILN